MNPGSRPVVLALCGSLASASVNRTLLDWMAAEVSAALDVRIFEGLAAMPLFNPDGLAGAPEAVVHFKASLATAAGVLICSPEYAMGPPGALKNALDWTVASADFSGKPVLLVTAASLGEKSHASLLGTLRVIEARLDDESQVLISFAKAKIGADGVRDDATRTAVQAALRHFTAQVLEAAG